MHPDELGPAPQAGAIGPIRREIVFEPLPEPVRIPAPPPEPARPAEPERPVEPVPTPS